VRSLIAESRWPARPFWRRRSAEQLGEPLPQPVPGERGTLRRLAAQVPLTRIGIRWQPGAHLAQKAVVLRNILCLRPAVASAAHPGGITAPALELERLFPLIDGKAPVDAVVDNYLAALGRGRDGRSDVLIELEQLIDEGACLIEPLP
jgi:hypothetical protein